MSHDNDTEYQKFQDSTNTIIHDILRRLAKAEEAIVKLEATTVQLQEQIQNIDAAFAHITEELTERITILEAKVDGIKYTGYYAMMKDAFEASSISELQDLLFQCETSNGDTKGRIARVQLIIMKSLVKQALKTR